MTTAANRSALAALATSNLAAYLLEAGREGDFVWDGSNLSSKVSADTSQGIYVAPNSDTSGASGAWVRKFSGAHNVRWFGATGDGTTNDSAAITAALSYLGAIGQSGYGYSSSTPEMFFPKGHYYLGTATLDLTYTIILTGEGTGGAGGAASLLRWAANTTGIRTQRSNTTGASGTQAPSGHGGDGSVIRNLYLKGAYSSSEGEYHGIHLRATATIRDCFIDGFEGDGIYVKATIGGGAGSEGAANLVTIDKVFVQNCRNGIYFEGADANAGTISAFSAISCRQWGIWDKSFLGNAYLGGHVAACSRTSANAASASQPAGYTSSGGNRYTVVRGQESGAATNAPSGTATDNTWWYYKEAGGADAGTGVIAYAGSLTWRAGGAYLIEGLNNASVLAGCYAEIDQVSQLDQTAIWLGSLNFGALKGTSSNANINPRAIRPSSSGITVDSKLVVQNDLQAQSQNNFLGINTGTVAENITTFYNANTSSILKGVGPGGNSYGELWLSYSGILGMIMRANTKIRFDIGTTATCSLTANGFGYDTGVGGTVTQSTNKSTGVTLNKVCGSITMNNAALAANAVVSFTLTNSKVSADDYLDVWVKSGNAAAGTYQCWSEGNGSGSRVICLRNISGASRSEAIVLGFGVNKRVTA